MNDRIVMDHREPVGAVEANVLHIEPSGAQPNPAPEPLPEPDKEKPATPQEAQPAVTVTTTVEAAKP